MTVLGAEAIANGAKSTRPGALAYLAAFYGVVLLSEAFLMLFDNAVQGYIVDLRQPLLFGLLICPFIFWRSLVRMGVSDVANLCVAVIGFSIVSTLWSSNPAYTAIASLSLLSNYFFAVLFVRTFSLAEIVKILSNSFVLIVFSSYIMVFFWPQLGIEQNINYNGAWAGIFYFKNHLGRYAILALIFFYLRYIVDGRPVFISAMMFLAAILLFMSGSATGVLALLALLGAAIVVRVMRSSGPTLSFLAILIVGMSLVVIYQIMTASAILELFGKDVTLTGRTRIWGAAIYFIENAPLRGYGYSGFFSEAMSPNRDYFGYLSGWPEVPHVHNGILQIALDIGLPGATLAFAAFLVAVVMLIRKARSVDHLTLSFCYLIIVFVFSVNVSEPLFFKFNDLSTTLFFIVFILLAQRFSGVRAQ